MRFFTPDKTAKSTPAKKRRGSGSSWFWLMFFIGLPTIMLAAGSRQEAAALGFVWVAMFAALWFFLAFYFPERARSVSIFWAHVADAVQRFQEQRGQSSYMVED